MKQNITTFFALCFLCASLCGCAQTGDHSGKPGSLPGSGSQTTLTEDSKTSEQDILASHENSRGEKATGFRMVSDGEFIYYSQFAEPGLRKINTDLSSEVLLADEDSLYLNLVGDTLYYIVPDSGIWQVKTDGSDHKQLEMANNATHLSHDNGTLYYLQDYQIYRYNLDAVNETVKELEEEYGAAAASDEAAFFRSEKLSDEYVDSLAVGQGRIFYVASKEDKDTLFMMDPDSLTPTVIASGLSSNIFADDGRLYYQEVERISDLDENTRICSIDLSGNDRKVHFEEKNAGAYFTASGGTLYFTRYQARGEDNFEGSYIYRMDITGGEAEEFYIDYDVSMMLEAAGGYIWFDHYSYDNQTTNDYWGKADGSHVAMLQDMRPIAERSEFLEPYVEPYGPGESYLSLVTESMSACYKLVRMDDTVELVQFLEPNSTMTVSFPNGRYVLKIAEGNEWLGDDEAFGEEGHYSTTDIFKFQDGFTYEIVAGKTGNFSSDNKDGFLD